MRDVVTGSDQARRLRDQVFRKGVLYWALLIGTALAFVLGFNRYLPLVASGAYFWALLCSLAVVVVILFVASLWPRLLFPVFGLFLYVGVLERYVMSFGVSEPQDLITNLMESDWREVSGFIDIGIVVAAIVVGLLGFLIVKLLWWLAPVRIPTAQLKRHRWTVMAGLIGLTLTSSAALLVPKPQIEEATEQFLQASFWPVLPFVQALRTAKGYYLGEQQYVRKIEGLPSAASFPSTYGGHPEGLTVAFVFGESVRAANWGLNGYRRETTPRLAKEPGVINFSDALSFGIFTQVSSIGMLTPATFQEPVPKAGSFIDLFVKHGFDTAGFISARPTSTMLKLIAPLAQKSSRREIAMELLPKIEHFLAEKTTRDKFLFIYTEGNHFPYKRDYSPDYASFLPDDHGRWNLGSDREQVVNAYDNAVLYTDAFLGAIIDLLRNQRAVLIYMADHGDALGEEGNFIRGGTMTSPYLRQVPFFVWVSDSYARSEPGKVAALRANAKLPIAHQYSFHTVLGLADIESPLKDPGLDLTRKGARPRGFEVKDGEPPGSIFHQRR
jgi:lipid A ethanolaminephosphotransferase